MKNFNRLKLFQNDLENSVTETKIKLKSLNFNKKFEKLV